MLAPLYREAGVVGDLVARLRRLDYPRDLLDVKLVLEADDAATIEAARRADLGDNFEILIAPAGKPRTKPKALNFALSFARGEFVAVYDAEDAPHPRQLRAALDAFAAGGPDLGVVQAPLRIDNGRQSWIAMQFAVEYAIQFQEVLPLAARLRAPLMLGGTSNHFRAVALCGAGAWDPYNVTEDADIGYRLARDGWRAAMIAEPTWEEAPLRFGGWLRQRTRWIKGHLQTWLVLMRNPLRTGRELGWGGFAMMHLMLGGALAAAAMHGAIFVALAAAAFLPGVTLSWHGWALALFGYCTAAYGALTAAATLGDPRLALAALTMPLYWPLHTIAAVRAVLELLIRPHYWAKTEHGLSRREDPPS